MSNLQGGYTFFNTYQTCQRKFWFRYIARWEPLVRNPKMLWGELLHRATAEVTRLYLEGQGYDLFELYHNMARETALEDDKLIETGFRLLNLWERGILPQDKGKRCVVLDQLVGIDVDGFNFLIKPDRILYDVVTGQHEIIELKTTGFSGDVALANVQRTRQGTAYIWAWSKRFPNKVVKMFTPEILYAKGNTYSVRRCDPVYRTKAELERFEFTLQALIREVAIKMSDGDPQWFLERFGCTEGSYFGCDYANICGSNYTSLPPGFKARISREEVEDV